jgi:hypothetical protein
MESGESVPLLRPFDRARDAASAFLAVERSADHRTKQVSHLNFSFALPNVRSALRVLSFAAAIVAAVTTPLANG